jgi:hypothetical protein
MQSEPDVATGSDEHGPLSLRKRAEAPNIGQMAPKSRLTIGGGYAAAIEHCRSQNSLTLTVSTWIEISEDDS